MSGCVIPGYKILDVLNWLSLVSSIRLHIRALKSVIQKGVLDKCVQGKGKAAIGKFENTTFGVYSRSRFSPTQASSVNLGSWSGD